MNAKQLETFNNEIANTYELTEQEYLGRGGYVNKDQFVLEIRGSITKPIVRKVNGLGFNSKTGKIEFDNSLLPYSEDVSRSGNGIRCYKIPEPGFYIAENLINSGYRLSFEYVVVSDAGVSTCYRDDIGNDCKILFSESYSTAKAEKAAWKAEKDAAAAEAEKINTLAVGVLTEINAERATIQSVEIEGYIVEPRFDSISLGGIIERIKWKAEKFNADEYIALNSLAKYYEAEFVKADTPEEVVEKIKAKKLEREEAINNAKKLTETLKLPELSGSPKQIAWAMQIRAKVAEANPSDTRLKKATTAKYWIENR